MNERDLSYLRDMLHHAEKAMSFMVGQSRADLDGENMLSFAVVRTIEIIGEAAAHVSAETRQQYPSIDWIPISAMRNRLVHDYLRVDFDIVWKVVQVNLPELVQALHTILDE